MQGDAALLCNGQPMHQAMRLQDAKDGGKVSEEAEPKPDAEPPKQPAAMAIGMATDQPGTLIIKVDMLRVDRLTARGLLLDADAFIQSWYAEKAAMSRKLATPGMMDSLKMAGRSFGQKIGLVR